MHARVTMALVHPDRFDEAVTTVTETFQPAAREFPGFRGFLLLTDPATHQLIGISLWQSEADLTASASDSGYYASALAEFNAMLVAPATTTTHEVAAFET
jgi:heme-degrading monooxygenase HmoA